jgi:ribonuclease P protein component
MLANPYRITKEADFERVKKKGKKYATPLFTCLVLKRKDKDLTRFGFVVSTHASKLAVKRNFIKRITSEAVRQAYSYVQPGYDVVFIAKPEAAQKYTAEIMIEVRAALGKIGVLK